MVVKETRIINFKFTFTFSNSLQTVHQQTPKLPPTDYNGFGPQRTPTNPNGPQQTPKDPKRTPADPNPSIFLKPIKEFIKCIPSILFTAQMQGMLGL